MDQQKKELRQERKKCSPITRVVQGKRFNNTANSFANMGLSLMKWIHRECME
jgi:hypothetical protein